MRVWVTGEKWCMSPPQDHESPFEMCWAFSIYLEAVAILPQLFMLQKQGPLAPICYCFIVYTLCC